MAGPSDLHALCVEWLASVVEALEATAAGAPAAQFVSPGPPAFACEQVSVHAGGPSEADTLPLSPPLVAGQRATDQGAVHLVNMTATVLRCGPVPGNDGSIDVAKITEKAAVVHADVWAVWNYTRYRHREGTLFPSPGSSRELIFDPASPVAEEGGIIGWEIPIRVQLGGFRPA